MTPKERETMQMALDALELVDGYVMGKHEAKEALYEALAQPEQEPWGYISHRSWKMPVFVEADDLEVSGLPFNNPDYTPVYKAPPQREFIGLTDEEKETIYQQADEENWHDQPLLEAVEAKLREKNHE